MTSKHLGGIADPSAVDWNRKDDEYWREVLSTEQYEVCRRAGTERAFTGRYNDAKTPGMYHCACCGQGLFSSEDKFDSGSGWPSFTRPVNPEALTEQEDRKLLMTRVEIRCSRCDAHLGHVFDDGPPPTGKRYCMNSVCLLHEADWPA